MTESGISQKASQLRQFLLYCPALIRQDGLLGSPFATKSLDNQMGLRLDTPGSVC
jgi:hypothetical protein